MVSGTIDHDEAVIPPAWCVPIERLHQLPDVDSEGSFVGVILRQGDVRSPFGVDRSDHRDLWLDQQLIADRGAVADLPLCPLEVRAADQSLINVDDSYSRLDLLQHEGGELLT